VFDADGSAIVIHSGKDDYKSDPAGDAGSRIACGVVQ
jgi:Cu-Zn family superoxide dismutase